MNQVTRELIQKYSPMWTNKQVWEFDQINENLVFDILIVEPKKYDDTLWKSNSAYLNSDIRDTIAKIFDYLLEGDELWIANKGQSKLDEIHVQYVMATLVDMVVDEEICLNFRIENNFLVASIDSKADVIDCKEFFEEFYHLATGFNYDVDTGIPDDETEAEIHLTRLQEDFDEKMKSKLGEKYLPGNNDPDTLNSK